MENRETEAGGGVDSQSGRRTGRPAWRRRGRWNRRRRRRAVIGEVWDEDTRKRSVLHASGGGLGFGGEWQGWGDEGLTVIEGRR